MLATAAVWRNRHAAGRASVVRRRNRAASATLDGTITIGDIRKALEKDAHVWNPKDKPFEITKLEAIGGPLADIPPGLEEYLSELLSMQPIPEPATSVLGLGLLLALRRR